MSIIPPESATVANARDALSVSEVKDPEIYCCPITKQLMKDPVQIEGDDTRHVFDHSSVKQYIRQKNGHWECPLCRHTENHPRTVPLPELKKNIKDYRIAKVRYIEYLKTNKKKVEKINVALDRWDDRISELRELDFGDDADHFQRQLDFMIEALNDKTLVNKNKEVVRARAKQRVDEIQEISKAQDSSYFDSLRDDIDRSESKSFEDQRDIEAKHVHVQNLRYDLKKTIRLFLEFFVSLVRFMSSVWPKLENAMIGALAVGSVAGGITSCVAGTAIVAALPIGFATAPITLPIAGGTFLFALACYGIHSLGKLVYNWYQNKQIKKKMDKQCGKLKVIAQIEPSTEKDDEQEEYGMAE